MNFLPPFLESYLNSLLPERGEIFLEMEALAEKRGFPAIGPLVGRLLYQCVKLTGVKQVFELGSGFGYSALWIASALPEDGKIICTEYSKENAEVGMKFLDRAHLLHKVTYEVGDALENFHRYPGPFDLIFCDIDKHQYPQALEASLPKLKSGGLFVADNVLWSGKVADCNDTTDATEGIRRFNRMIYSVPKLFSTVIPLRDGVSISVKE
ncbi:MAG: O-methyltransferase [bacterium]